MNTKSLPAFGSWKSSLKWRIRDSLIYTLAQHARSPKAARARHHEILFFNDLLARFASPLIFDIGANVGSKAAIFRRYGRVICVEPDPAAAQSLRERFFGIRKVEIVEAAVAASSGHQILHRYGPGSAYNSLVPPAPGTDDTVGKIVAQDVATVSIRELINRYGPPQYIKVDAEGYEWPILSLMDRPIPLVSMEFNLPQFAEEMKLAVNHLAALSTSARFNAVISEPPCHFEFPTWATATETLDRITAHGWRYAEIFCLSHTA